jgi:hypothetical protein
VDCIKLDRPLLLLESQSGPLTNQSHHFFSTDLFPHRQLCSSHHNDAFSCSGLSAQLSETLIRSDKSANRRPEVHAVRALHLKPGKKAILFAHRDSSNNREVRQ